MAPPPPDAPPCLEQPGFLFELTLPPQLQGIERLLIHLEDLLELAVAQVELLAQRIERRRPSATSDLLVIEAEGLGVRKRGGAEREPGRGEACTLALRWVSPPVTGAHHTSHVQVGHAATHVDKGQLSRAVGAR